MSYVLYNTLIAFHFIVYSETYIGGVYRSCGEWSGKDACMGPGSKYRRQFYFVFVI